MAKKGKMSKLKRSKKRAVVGVVEGGNQQTAENKSKPSGRQKRTSIDKALGMSLTNDESGKQKRHSIDLMLSKGEPIDAEDLLKSMKAADVAAKDSSDEEIEYFDAAENEGETSVAEAEAEAGAKGTKDDEFDYAFEGKAREGKTHKKTYKATKAPGNIFMGKSDEGAIIEEGEEYETSPETSEARREVREKSIDMTEEQWSAIIKIQYEDEKEAGENDPEKTFMLEETVIYEEAIASMSPNLDAKYASIEAYEPGCWASYMSCFQSIFNEPEFVKRHKSCILHLAQSKFQNDNPKHETVLASIYCAIYGEEVTSVKRYGRHWETIGFQGKDPATDLRDTGLWGLLQILFLVENCFNFAQSMFDYSHDPNYGFPLCAMAINICGIGLDLLQEGAFDRPSLEVKSLHRALNLWYCGAMLSFFRTWKESRATISDAGVTLELLRKHYFSGSSSVRMMMQEGSKLTESYMEENFGEDEEEVEFSQF